MQMAVIIDVILGAVLVLCAVLGWRRGAFRSVIGVVIVVFALLGAAFVSDQGAPLAAKALTPLISNQIEARFEKTMQEDATLSQASSDISSAVKLFSAAGFYQQTAQELAQEAAAQAKETGQTILRTAVEQVLLSVARAVLFALTFVILLVALKLAAHVLGLLTAVPGLHFMNASAGALLGLIQGALALFAVVWLLQFFGSGISEELVAQSYLLRFFVLRNPAALAFSL
jgi:hypothetical protein